MEFFQEREGDLDAMIEAHRLYLDRMVKKVLLLSSKTGKEVSLHFKPVVVNLFSVQEALLMQVQEVFATILQFREAMVRFSNVPEKPYLQCVG